MIQTGLYNGGWKQGGPTPVGYALDPGAPHWRVVAFLNFLSCDFSLVGWLQVNVLEHACKLFISHQVHVAPVPTRIRILIP